MGKHYDGLDAIVIPVNGNDIVAVSPKCIGTILNVIENGICISDKEFQFIEYYTPEDPEGGDDW